MARYLPFPLRPLLTGVLLVSLAPVIHLPLAAQVTPLGEPFSIPPPEELEGGEYRAVFPPSAASLAEGGFQVTWDLQAEGHEGRILSAVVTRQLSPTAGPGPGLVLADDHSFDNGVEAPRVVPFAAAGYATAWVRLLQVGSLLETSTRDGEGTTVVAAPALDTPVVSSPGMAAGQDRYLLAWEQVDVSPTGSSPASEVVAYQIFDGAGDPVIDAGTLSRHDGDDFVTVVPAAAAIPAGAPGGPGFLVVWYERGSGSTEPGLRADRLDLDGRRIGRARVVDGFLGEGDPAVLWDGPDIEGRIPASYVVAAAGGLQQGSDGESVRPILMRRFAADGAALGPALEVGTTSTGTGVAGAPALARDRHGNFLVLWKDGSQPVLRAVNRALVPQGEPLPVPTADPNGLISSSPGGLAILGDQALVVERQILGAPGPPGDTAGAFYRLLRDDDACVVDGNTVLCDTRGDGSQFTVSYRFGVDGDTFLLADSDGDGYEEVCIHRANRFLCDAAQNGGRAEVQLPFGVATDQPILADLDGDGRDDPCIRRGNRLLCDTARNGGRAEVRSGFGLARDVLLVGDVDGDGRDEPCVVKDRRFRCDTALDGGVGEVQLDLDPILDDTEVARRYLLLDADGDGRDDPCALAGDVLTCGLFQPFGGPATSSLERRILRQGNAFLFGDVDAF